jgi:hypothetical protein
MQRSLTGERLAALCALGWLLFNYPLLALFNDGGSWFGIPHLYAYLFIAWAAFIGLLALVAEKIFSHKTSSGDVKAGPSVED